MSRIEDQPGQLPGDAPDARAAALSRRVRSLRLPQEPPRSRSWFRRLVWLPVLLLLGLLAWHFLPRGKGEPAAKPTAESNAAAAASAAPPAESDVVLESKGYVIPTRKILISPKVSGMIERLFVLEGMRVVKDQVLAELEKTDYISDRDHAKAALESAVQRRDELRTGYRKEEIEQSRAELAETEELLRQYTSEYQRTKRLHEQNALSIEDFEAAQARYLSTLRRAERLRFAVRLMEEGPRRERIDAAEADVRQAQADLLKAQWRLDNTTIRAPISGTILQKNAEEGNIVNPIAFNGSFSLCEMADLSDLEVDLSIQERDVARIFPDQRCRIRSDAFPDRLYEGWVSRLMPIADRAKGAVPVRVKVIVSRAEEGMYLKPEMSAIVTFFAGKIDPAKKTRPAGAGANGERGKE